MRVTATVESDVRLSWEVSGDVETKREVVDVSALAGWKQVHQSSVFSGAENVGAPLTQDDNELVKALALRYSEAKSTATEAQLALGWFDPSYYVGDIIERVEGRQFELSPNPDFRPYVNSVRHQFGETQTTHLIVSG